ncbi:hypothetical protein QT990_24995 [Microcoleus sp. T3_B1]
MGASHFFSPARNWSWEAGDRRQDAKCRRKEEKRRSHKKCFGSISMKAAKLEIGIRSQESGARRKESEGRRKKCFCKYEMLPVFLQI